MSEWRDISSAPRDGVFVCCTMTAGRAMWKDFGTRAVVWSANTRIPGIEPCNQSRAADALETTDGRRKEILKPLKRKLWWHPSQRSAKSQ